ncbi:MauE/DoxX family redox-associated membrane protein [Caldalkalibacillus mannanilyticus]|uniref:MauE/DoxX family redox-associated membrane protein n=1 Tax=Caldalkalibacillus mannanilyticus TaxID=1418 RepID=UPI000469D6F8|nr:MauE/DoxX family redox-associated membrane protein [Caldalkalibacillus mannanilyticus]
MSWVNVSIWLLSAVVGTVFIRSSSGKISNSYAFDIVIQSYKALNKKSMTKWIAIIMGPLELSVGLLLVFNIYRFEVALFGIFLQFIFVLLMLINMNRVLPYGCGCFGLHAPEKIRWTHVMKNAALLVSLIMISLFSY